LKICENKKGATKGLCNFKVAIFFFREISTILPTKEVVLMMDGLDHLQPKQWPQSSGCHFAC
jgi:hypothetical protein